MTKLYVILTIVAMGDFSILSQPHHNKSTVAVDTTNRLAALRKLMHELDALLITTDNQHQTEATGGSEKRREYITGFTGSRGDAIVTLEKAALWVDGRYHLQGDEQVNSNWLVMKEGNAGVPSKAEWLNKQFPAGATIGADGKLVPASVWLDLEAELKKFNNSFEFVSTSYNLVDKIWTDRPTEKVKRAYTLDDYYTGEAWTEKVKKVRERLKELDADGMVVTALDEVAWLLNIRGWDVPYSGYVKGYVIITPKDIVLYANRNKIKGNVTEFFKTKYPGQLKFKRHSNIWIDLPKYCQQLKKILVPSSAIYNAGASKKVYDSIPNEKRLFHPSPIIYLKAKKNPTEIEGMRRAHARDSVALCRALYEIDKKVKAGANWDELKVAETLEKFRSAQRDFVSMSFASIVAYGPHGALPHYEPTESTSSVIYKNSTVVIDSGGQYYDGTTDVTRTLHFGNPSKQERDTYTRVLIGCIELSSLIFPENLDTTAMDVFARAALWHIGYDYPHGTGHTIGSFTGVHEDPIRIAYNKKPGVLKPGYFTSIEPGFYLDGHFGIRLENIAEVVKRDALSTHNGLNFLGFNDITLVPYDKKLIDTTLLNDRHKRWLNRYNHRIRESVGRELRRQNEMPILSWLWRHTQPVS